jgi:AcrR family transcriptional regulator
MLILRLFPPPSRAPAPFRSRIHQNRSPNTTTASRAKSRRGGKRLFLQVYLQKNIAIYSPGFDFTAIIPATCPSPLGGAPIKTTAQSTKTSSSAKSRRGRKRQFTPDDVISAAVNLLDEVGPEGVHLSAVARRLGIHASSMYTYFKTTEELSDAVRSRLMDKAVFPSLDSHLPLKEQLLNLVQLMRDFYRRDPRLTFPDTQSQSYWNDQKSTDLVIGVLIKSGITLPRAVTIVEVITGAAFSNAVQASKPHNHDQALLEYLSKLPESEYKNIRSVIRAKTEHPEDFLFRNRMANLLDDLLH